MQKLIGQLLPITDQAPCMAVSSVDPKARKPYTDWLQAAIDNYLDLERDDIMGSDRFVGLAFAFSLKPWKISYWWCQIPAEPNDAVHGVLLFAVPLG